MLDHVLAFIGQYSYPAIFALLFASGCGAPLSEDLILVAVGLLVGKSVVRPELVIPVAYVGVLLGDCCLFLLGRRFGSAILTHRWAWKICPPPRYAAISARFQKWGALAVFGARFLAGARAATFFSAGTLKIPIRRFVLADLCGAAITVPGTILLARAGTDHLDVAKRVLGAIVLAVIVGFVVRALVKRRRPGANVAEAPPMEDAGP